MKKSAIIILFTISLLFTGCYSTRNATWHCYDEKGRPVEGVLIICNYGLAGYAKRAVNHRFTDANGQVLLDFDEDTPRELMRGFDCIYSAKLRSGDSGIGARWHQGAPIPNAPVYFDEYNNNIYIKDGTGDPLIWGGAINQILHEYSRTVGARIYSHGKESAPGMAKLEKTLAIIAPEERALFLAKYSEKSVPVFELYQRGLQGYFVDFTSNSAPGLRFKDIIFELPPFAELKK